AWPAGLSRVSARATTELPAPPRTGIVGERTRLVLLSFLMLFLELALIRWTGSNVVSLSYFSNFVLLGSFLGIGLGFLRARRARSIFPWAPVVLGILAFVALSFLGAPPLAWGAIVAAVFVIVYVPFGDRRVALVQGAALAGLVLILGIESFAAHTYWSPYYKIETHTEHSPATA